MKNENFKKGIEELRKGGLTGAEKETMLKNIMDIPVKSPYVKGHFVLRAWAVFGGYPRFSYAFMAAVVFIFSGTSVMYAAEMALPGDILYGVKVDVTEPLLNKLMKVPEARAEWELTKVTRRLEEAETLARVNKLDETKRVNLEKNFEKHTDEMNAVLLEIKNKGILAEEASSTEASTKVVEDKFNSAVSSHKKTLENISIDSATRESQKKEIETFRATIERKTEKERGRSDDRKRGGEKEESASGGRTDNSGQED
jgi:hypothetical protein